jgi:integrase
MTKRRMVSLRVAHGKDCPNSTKTALTSVGRGSGCTCQPSYYTFQRTDSGGVLKGPRVKDRQAAERALTAAQRELDEHRAGVAPRPDVTFNEWADEFDRILDQRVRAGTMKRRTAVGYRETMAHGREAFGAISLNAIGPAELRRFLDRFAKQQPASRLRQLRQLSVVFQTAAKERVGGRKILEENPVPDFTKDQRLEAPKRGKAPFEDGELERLYAALRQFEPVYLWATRFAVETGVRLSELVALEWADVSLSERTVRVDATWDAVDGRVMPKDGEQRVIYLTADAQAVLEGWVAAHTDGPPTDGPVFTDPITSGRLVPRQLQRRLAAAMKLAGIPKEHPQLRLPRSWHSLRYTTSNVMQRRGYHPRLIEATLGHSSLELTYGVYGGWTPDQLAAAARRDDG